VSHEERFQLVVVERSELEEYRRARPPDTFGQSSHTLVRRGLFRSVRRNQQNRPVVEVVREIDDEIERRGIRSMQILEHEQHGSFDGALGEQPEGVFEHAQLRPRVDVRKLTERTKRFYERLIRKVRADEIERATQENLESCRAGAGRELGDKPGLPDTGLAGDEDGDAAPRLCRSERTLELPELASPSYERRGGASLHPVSIAPSPR
jgi:hypothetical protein